MEERTIEIMNQIVKMTATKANVIADIRRRIFGFNKQTGREFTSISPSNLLKCFSQDGYVIFIIFLIFPVIDFWIH